MAPLRRVVNFYIYINVFPNQLDAIIGQRDLITEGSKEITPGNYEKIQSGLD